MFGSPSPNLGSLLSSSSSDDDDDDMFVSFSSRPRRRQPKPIKGSKTSFILGDKLGEGAYAVVKEGIDQTTLRIVAVKILDLRRLRRMRGVMAALDREVRVQKSLKRHNNLIELIDVIKSVPKSKMYIVLEMATGCTVHELLDASPTKTLCESQVANFAYQTLTGLCYMHGRGYIHRDIKPANLMLTADGTIKISDFGVAEQLEFYQPDDNVSRTSGSPAFQAPEIARGDLGYSGTKVDVWALGITIYMLLSGDVPFKGDMLMMLFENIKTGKYKMVNDVSEDCQDVISQMLTMSWEDRPAVDKLLRHPWVEGGALELSDGKKKELGWVPIPKKEFGILEVVKRMYMTDDDGMADAPTSPTIPGIGQSTVQTTFVRPGDLKSSELEDTQNVTDKNVTSNTNQGNDKDGSACTII